MQAKMPIISVLAKTSININLYRKHKSTRKSFEEFESNRISHIAHMKYQLNASSTMITITR